MALTRETVKEFDFNGKDFERVRAMIYKRAGIALADSKQEMVYSRLARRLRATGITTFVRYLDDLEAGRMGNGEWEAFTNALTTNLTSFFRESHHFPLLAEHIKARRGEPINIWCSASSTGEEPYSIAITCCEAFNTLTPPVHILATDIDTNVLATAAQGVYPMERIEKLTAEQQRRFFMKGRGANEGMARVRQELRQLITYRQLNLLDEKWDIRPGFDIIFCRNVMIYFDKDTQRKIRNVMIYFDKDTQRKILKRFVPLMKPDALLFAGHSENFLYVSDALKLRGKTVYELDERKLGAGHAAAQR